VDTPVDVRLLHGDLIVLDAVYSPLETSLLREARAVGALGVDGVWMLVEQARLQQYVWFGEMPDATVMRREAEARLAARQ
jgi:shikimate dehydrogenase